MPRFALDNGHYLRPLKEADMDELHALIERNHAQLAKWMQWAQDQTATRCSRRTHARR